MASFSEQDYVAADACALSQAVRDGLASPIQLLAIARDRAQRLQARLGAMSQFVPRVADAAIAALDGRGDSDRKIDPPLAGVPFVVKDLGAALAGAPTLAGSRALRNTPAAVVDGALIARLRAAGVVPFAKTTVPEFGLNLASEPVTGEPSRNPWSPDFSAGGSSGGSAVAVAAGIVPIAHATDAGGSIRIPAAACGVLGLKPGRGAIPWGPDFGNVFGTMAAEFVLARSVRDCAMVWDLVGPRSREDRAGGGRALATAKPLRIALLRTAPQGVDVDARWRDAADSVADWLRGAGHSIELFEARFDASSLAGACADAEHAFATYACRSAAAAAEVLRPSADELEPVTWLAARRGQALTALAHHSAEVAVARVTEKIAALFESIDVLLTPALACALPRVGELRTDIDDLDEHFARFTRYAPFSVLANASGCPAIVVPHGRDALQRPLAVQLMARHGAEDTLLHLAAHLETQAPWPRIAPL